MERAVPTLPADDIEEARRFYVDGLGFSVTFHSDYGEGASLLGLRRGTIELTVDCPMDGHGRDACAALYVDDADGTYDEWSSRVEIRRAPRDEEWGARTFDVIDPSGNTLFVIGPPAPH